MSYPNLLSYIFRSEWAMDRSTLTGMIPAFHARMISGEPLERALVAGQMRERETVMGKQRDGYLFASGICGKHLSGMDELCSGGLSLDKLQAGLREAANLGAKSIVLHMDTPGGTVYGVRQTVKLIEDIRASGIRVAGYVDSMCCSAGQWILAGCDVVYMDAHADIGSIGVYSALIDYTEWFKKNGLKMERFVGDEATYKGMGVEGTSLTEKQRAWIQARVHGMAKEFKADVRRLRGDVPEDAMQGQALRGSEAIEAGLADALVDSVEDVFDDLG